MPISLLFDPSLPTDVQPQASSSGEVHERAPVFWSTQTTVFLCSRGPEGRGTRLGCSGGMNQCTGVQVDRSTEESLEDTKFGQAYIYEHYIVGISLVQQQTN